jgi:tRNA (cmo5U34)-methyltransferase
MTNKQHGGGISATNRGETGNESEREPASNRHDDITDPGGRWQFDEKVTQVFDDMLERSIPQYEVMRRAVTNVAARYMQPTTAILDLGTSRGEVLAALLAHGDGEFQFLGIEASKPMLVACRERFKESIETGVIDIRKMDLRTEYPDVMASVTTSVLTLQFLPLECRQQVLTNVYDHTISGGAFILVEKVLGCTSEIDSLMVDEYYKLKRKNGYSMEQIERKRLSLEGSLVPVTAGWNEDLLRMAGFRKIDCFWRWMNFAAWVAIKE